MTISETHETLLVATNILREHVRVSATDLDDAVASLELLTEIRKLAGAIKQDVDSAIIDLTADIANDRDQRVIELDDGKARAVMTGDVVHHPVQIERPHWCSNFDADQARAKLTRQALLETLADTDTLMMPAHFAAPSAVRIVSEADGFFYSADGSDD